MFFDRRFYLLRKTELLIVVGRVILSTFFLIAVILDPSQPLMYSQYTDDILTGYLVYSLIFAFILWCRISVSERSLIFLHAIDLSVFAVLMSLTEGTGSPFFAFFVFLLVCATMRWHWRGTAWTAAASLGIIAILSLLPVSFLGDHHYEPHQIVIRVSSLVIVSIMLAYLGANFRSRQGFFLRLANWPSSNSSSPEDQIRELLEYATGILGASRLLLAWEEPEEPWLNLAHWSQNKFSFIREHPAAYGTVVAEQLSGSSFFCKDAANSLSPIILESCSLVEGWQSAPLHNGLLSRFDIHAVLALRLVSKNISGYLLVLDKPNMNTDDLIVGTIVTHEIATRLEMILLLEELQKTAVSEERMRIARNLHDGLLQLLAGTALQLESASRLMETKPEQAQKIIHDIQRLLATEQSELRAHINELRPNLNYSSEDEFDLDRRIGDLIERIGRQWENISLTINNPAKTPRLTKGLGREIYFIIHESVINSVRHSGATEIVVDLNFTAAKVHIIVADNGSGFLFRGRFDHKTLCTLKRGPVTLRERVTELGGTLAIDSRDTGSRLDIFLPLTVYGR